MDVWSWRSRRFRGHSGVTHVSPNATKITSSCFMVLIVFGTSFQPVYASSPLLCSFPWCHGAGCFLISFSGVIGSESEISQQQVEFVAWNIQENEYTRKTSLILNIYSEPVAIAWKLPICYKELGLATLHFQKGQVNAEPCILLYVWRRCFSLLQCRRSWHCVLCITMSTEGVWWHFWTSNFMETYFTNEQICK